MFTISLFIGLAVAIGVSSMAAGMIRTASAELLPETRDRIYKSENKFAKFWRLAEWVGIILILAGMLPQVRLFTLQSQRVLTIAAGLLLFCLANALSSWSSFVVYKKEAPSTNASRAAFRGATLVSLAELALLSIVFWIVTSRLGINFNAKPPGSTVDSAEVTTEDPALWMDESSARVELVNLNKEYIDGLVESGDMRTTTLDGKKVFRRADVERWKKKKGDVIP